MYNFRPNNFGAKMPYHPQQQIQETTTESPPFDYNEFLDSGEFKAGLIIGIAVLVMLIWLAMTSHCCGVLRICCLDCFGCRVSGERVYELQRMEEMTAKPSAPESNGFYGENLKSFKDK